MLVYLAHPVDQAPTGLANLFATHPLTAAVNEVAALGNQLGHGFFRPATAYVLPRPPWAHDVPRKVNEVNDLALYSSDAVVAVLLPAVPTLGTVAEVEKSLLQNKPTVLVTTSQFAAASVQVRDWLDRGAKLLEVDEGGRLSTSAPDRLELFSRLLRHKPRTQDFDSEVVEGPPPLLVSGEAANLKERTYVGDAGLDLALAHEVKLAPGEFKRLGTGVHVAVPDGYYGLITARSSTWSNHRCTVVEGVIDAGYRGELTVGLRNEGEDTVGWQVGSRPAQFILLPVWGGKVEVVAELPEADRGHSGYGSTGK